jgi:predicted Zn-dependent protease
MARKVKTTFYVDEDVMRSIRVSAARQGRPVSQIVEEARALIAGWRADLVLSLAAYNEAAGHPQASIAYLKSALAQCPHRQDLARLLVAAYLQTGQTARASEARLEYDLTQER